jgi:hypothetical protein
VVDDRLVRIILFISDKDVSSTCTHIHMY